MGRVMGKEKLGLWEYIRPLLCENEGGFSLGRITLWLTLAPAITLWWAGEDIKENHLYVLGLLLLYNFSKKIPAFVQLIKAWKGTS